MRRAYPKAPPRSHLPRRWPRRPPRRPCARSPRRSPCRAHLIAHKPCRGRLPRRPEAPVEHVLGHHVNQPPPGTIARSADHLGSPDDGRHRRMALEVLRHLVDRRAVLPAGRRGDGGHEPQRDGVPAGVQSRHPPCRGCSRRRTASRRPRLGQKLNRILDHARGQLEHLLDADGPAGRGPRVPEAALGQKRVCALGHDDDLRCDLVLAGADADDFAGLVLHSSTAMQMYSAPAPSAFSANHWSKGPSQH